MGEEHELKGLDSLGKKTPFYRTSRIQPLCAQVVYKRYYCLEEQYYCLAQLKQPNETENTRCSSTREVISLSGEVVPLGEVVTLIRGTTARRGTTAYNRYYRL